jgi:hypothetical protein
MTTELSRADAGGVQITPAATRSEILVLDQTLQAAQQEIAVATKAGNEILKAMTLAKATQRLRQLLTPALMEDVLALMNSPLGFKTDHGPGVKKNPQPYAVEIVRDMVITAMLDGAKLVGNEFNIIGSNYYRTLEQFERRIREYPGLTDLRLEIAVPEINQQRGSAVVDIRATWKLAGKAGSLACSKTATNDTRIPLKIDDYTGVDAILGKARRKFLARLLDHLDGSSFEAQDAVIDGTVTTVSVTQETADLPASQPSPQAEPTDANQPTRPASFEKLLEDTDGALATCELVLDASRIGKQTLDKIAAVEQSGDLSAGQADQLRKIVAGLVESRMNEIRKERGQRPGNE